MRTASATHGLGLLFRFWAAASDDPAAVSTVDTSSGPVPLGGRTSIDQLAWASVAFVSLAAAYSVGAREVSVDPDRAAAAFASERFLTVDRMAPEVWGDLSGFWATEDGWLRTHGNYPQHAAALCRALGVGPHATVEAVAAELSSLPCAVAERRILDAGGIAAVTKPENQDVAARLRSQPLPRLERVGDARHRDRLPAQASAPLSGVRVLDLTRVIAGPVATRTLALLGAEVLRIDPPADPEFGWLHLDTGHGKRSALLDAATPEGRTQMHRLLDSADVLVLGYRPAGMARLGLDPLDLARTHPGLVIGRLSAWGFGPRERARRGFDSIVQADCGLSWAEAGAGADRPAALPVPALDHSAGYLLAGAVIRALARQRAVGGTWVADVSLRRVAAELLGLPRRDEPLEPSVPAEAMTQDFDVEGIPVTTVVPALGYTDAPDRFAAPHPWGSDPARWAD